MKIELLDEVDSTNTYIKQYIAAGENVIVCAYRQSGGKGTKGREFVSEIGGVYLSALTFYDDLPADRAFSVMTHAAVSVCRAVQKFGVSPEIKWPNDVRVGGKKLCGILIENGITGGFIRYSVVGIGVNVVNDVSALNDIAINLATASHRACRVEEVRDALIRAYERRSDFAEYLSYVRFLGREVTVTEGYRIYRATAREILPDGRLVVDVGGESRVLSAAEISLRL